MKSLWLIIFMIGCCNPCPKSLPRNILFEEELQQRQRSWIHRYKNRPGVTLLPTADIRWLEYEARKK